VEIYRGKDTIDKFIKKMFEEVEDYKGVMREHFNMPLILTAEDEIDFQKSSSCHICERKDIYKSKELYRGEEIEENPKIPINIRVDNQLITDKQWAY